MQHFEKTLSEEYFYKGAIINLRRDRVELENGAQANREIVEHPGGVCVVALTDQNEVLFVNQFRYPYHKMVREIPAGKLSRGEDPFECGKRELQEETGATAGRYTFLGDFYPSPGYCEEIIRIYLAEELTFGSQNLDEDEFLDVERMPLEQAVQLVLENKIEDGKTQAGLLKAYLLVSRRAEK